jgi:uncharacterized protein (TIGR02466 family)
MASINLLEVANLTAGFNEKISRLALDKFMEFKKTVEAKEGQMSPNDLDDAFFAAQNTNPSLVERGESTAFWPALYDECPEYLQLIQLIRDACEEYIRRYARPGTLEGIKDAHTESMWSAVYIPSTVHSHHVHQGSIVSAVYYSKVGKSNTPIVFSDPRGAPPVQPYEQYEGEHDFEPEGPFHQQFNYFPKEGELVLFPSWLVHKVPSHFGESERVSWPFNYQGPIDSWSRTVV